jgi:hypothetical protein
MDFAYAPQVEALRQRVKAFMDDHVVPQIGAWQREVEAESGPPTRDYAAQTIHIGRCQPGGLWRQGSSERAKSISNHLASHMYRFLITQVYRLIRVARYNVKLVLAPN